MVKAIKISLTQRLGELKVIFKNKKKNAMIRKGIRRTGVVLKFVELRKRALRNSIAEKMARKGQRSVKTVDLGQGKGAEVLRALNLNCSICLEIMVQPCITPCGHAFCLPCIEESFKHKGACSLCRGALDFQSPTESKTLRTMLSHILKTLQDEDRQNYEKRVKIYAQKVEEQRIGPSVEIGEIVDFYMDGSWQQGSIHQIHRKGKEITVTIKAGQDKVRELQINSRLLAKHRTHTSEPSPSIVSELSFNFWQHQENVFFGSPFFSSSNQNFLDLSWDEFPVMVPLRRIPS